MKVTYTLEAIADLIEIFGYLGDRDQSSATRLEQRIYDKIARLAAQDFEGAALVLRSGAVVRSWPVPPLRVYYQRHTEELLIVRVYHQARRPITKPSRKRR